MRIAARRVLTPEGFRSDCVIKLDGGRVTGLSRGGTADFSCDTAVPGLMDQHLHGGLSVDVMNAGPEQLLSWLALLQRRGVTRVLAGVYTSPLPVMRRALAALRQAAERQRAGAPGARLVGVHLEGPFISPDAPGAMQTDFLLPPSVESYCALAEGYEDLIRLVSLAPEVPGADRLVQYLCARGVAVQAGHSAATAEQGRAAFAAGVRGVCHLFNAAAPFHHRRPGLSTEALLDDRVYCECIGDLVHIHPSLVRLIWKTKGPRRMILVSDAVSTTGLPDGTYWDNGLKIRVQNGESRTESGALNGGSALLMEEIRRLIALGIPQEDVFRMASETPADFLGMPGGRIVPGAPAEIVCLDETLHVQATVLGQSVAEGGEA